VAVVLLHDTLYGTENFGGYYGKSRAAVYDSRAKVVDAGADRVTAYRNISQQNLVVRLRRHIRPIHSVGAQKRRVYASKTYRTSDLVVSGGVRDRLQCDRENIWDIVLLYDLVEDERSAVGNAGKRTAAESQTHNSVHRQKLEAGRLVGDGTKDDGCVWKESGSDSVHCRSAAFQAVIDGISRGKSHHVRYQVSLYVTTIAVTDSKIACVVRVTSTRGTSRVCAREDARCRRDGRVIGCVVVITVGASAAREGRYGTARVEL